MFLGILIGEDTSSCMGAPSSWISKDNKIVISSALIVLMGDIPIFPYRIRMTNADELSQL